MIFTSSLACTTILSLGLYTVPKYLGYLCTDPRRGNTPLSQFDQVRLKMAQLQQKVQLIAGEKLWFFLTDMLADNAFLAIWAVSYVSKTPLLTETRDEKIYKLLFFVTLSTLLGSIRILLVRRVCPELGRYIGTRSVT